MRSTTVSSICAGIAALAAAASPACPVTEVDAYALGCEAFGTIGKPDIIQHATSATLLDCGSACLLASSHCRSLQYDAATQNCTLFGKHLHGMDVDFAAPQGAPLYERECFSTDCNTIDACSASASCDYYDYNFVYYYHSYSSVTFSQYACAYGKTAKVLGEKPTVAHFPATTSTCDAIGECAGKSRLGSFDVHFDLHSNRWVCVLFTKEATMDDYTARAQHVSRKRYTVANSSVGAGYGFYISDDYYV